jgi:hypothetical protein
VLAGRGDQAQGSSRPRREREEAEADTGEGGDDLFDVPDVDLLDPVPDPEPDDIQADDPPVEEIPAGMSAEAYCTGLQDAWCQFIAGCCSEQEQAELQARFNCYDPTASEYVAACIDRMSPLTAGGTIFIDEAAFHESCRPMLTLSTGECRGLEFFTQMFGTLFETYCGGVIDGRVTEGDHCASRLECEEGLCCSSGICIECMGEGMECTANDQCDAGQRCIGQTCIAPSRPGESCDLGDEVVLSDCMAGTWCAGDRCEPLLDAGLPCSDETSVDPCVGQCNDMGRCIEFCPGPGG